MNSLLRLSLVGLSSLCLHAAAQAQPGVDGINPAPLGVQARFGREMVIPLQRLPDDVAINLDGELSDTVWSQVSAQTGMWIVEPETLAQAPYDTEMQVFYTDDGIYIGVNMEQPADTLVRRITARDNREVNRDRVSFTLDTSG